MTESAAAYPQGATEASPEVVPTEAGSVTLVDLATLRTIADTAQKQTQNLELEAQSLRTLAEGLWAQRGSILLTKIPQWSPPPSVSDLLRNASSLADKLQAVDSQLADLQDVPHSGIGGVMAKAAGWNEHHKLAAERVQIAFELHPLVVEIGQHAPEVTVPDADVIGSQARAADSQAQEVASRAAESSPAASSARAELQRRTEAQREMGFDSLYLAAYLRTYGPQAVQSPLVLKRGEQACVSVTATLARHQTRRQWTGSSQGFSFPIGHTGIRYRVGSFHGHPVEQQLLARLDTGGLVVTNQRIAFIGGTKSTSVSLSKLLHAQCYSDGLVLFQEGRENPDFYLVEQPKYVLFFINWFLNQGAA
jgi:hypothetical protein